MCSILTPYGPPVLVELPYSPRQYQHPLLNLLRLPDTRHRRRVQHAKRVMSRDRDTTCSRPSSGSDASRGRADMFRADRKQFDDKTNILEVDNKGLVNYPYRLSLCVVPYLRTLTLRLTCIQLRQAPTIRRHARGVRDMCSGPAEDTCRDRGLRGAES